MADTGESGKEHPVAPPEIAGQSLDAGAKEADNTIETPNEETKQLGDVANETNITNKPIEPKVLDISPGKPDKEPQNEVDIVERPDEGPKKEGLVVEKPYEESKMEDVAVKESVNEYEEEHEVVDNPSDVIEPPVPSTMIEESLSGSIADILQQQSWVEHGDAASNTGSARSIAKAADALLEKSDEKLPSEPNEQKPESEPNRTKLNTSTLEEDKKTPSIHSEDHDTTLNNSLLDESAPTSTKPEDTKLPPSLHREGGSKTDGDSSYSQSEQSGEAKDDEKRPASVHSKSDGPKSANDSAPNESSETEPAIVDDIAPTDPEHLESEEEENYYLNGWRLVIMAIAPCLTMFAVCLDNTIISPAIPTITAEYKTISDIGWYGSSYLLTAASTQILYGKVYVLYSAKWVSLIALVLFELGSLVCAVAPTSVALIIGRAIAGLGAAGLLSGAVIVAGAVVPLSKRPILVGLVSALNGVASIAGPL
jgi:hypothetical protein